MKKKLTTILLALVLLCALCACSLASELNVSVVSPQDENVLHLALTEDILSPDVQVAGCDEIASNIYNRLLRLEENPDASASIAGDLAESYELSYDGRVYTFHLRENVSFHNGESFEADDVLYTIDRMLRPDTGALPNEAATYIYGAYDVMYGEAESVEGSGVIVIDKYTVKIILREPWLPFLASLCTPAWSIYNRDAKAAGAYSIGTGPYIFDEWVAGDYIFLRVNDNYFAERAQTDGVLYRIVPSPEAQLAMFIAGELDIVKVDGNEALINSYLGDSETKDYVIAEKKLNTYFYAMNQNLAPFNDVEVRLGLQKALDRRSILAEAFSSQGLLLNGILPSGIQGYDRSMSRIKLDREAAMELFAKAGYSEGFKLTICQNGIDPKENLINSMVAEQLSACSINVSIKDMKPADFYAAKTGGSLPMHLCHISIDLNEPYLIIGKVFGLNENVRYSLNIADDELLGRIEAAKNIADPAERAGEYAKIETLLVSDDAAVIPLFQVYSYVLLNPRVDNYGAAGDCVASFSLK